MAYRYAADARMAIGVYLSANHMGVVANKFIRRSRLSFKRKCGI